MVLMSKEVTNHTFAIPSPAHLSLRNIRGQVSIRPGETGQLSVVAVKHLDNGEPERTQIEMWQTDEGNVFIATRFDNGLAGRPCRVDYEVQIPAPCTVALRTVSGSALLERLEGSFLVKMVSGSVRLQELDGSLRVRTVSGDIAAHQLDGRLHLETVSGNVQIQSSHLDAVRLKTVNGNIRLETPLDGGPYRFESVSGDVQLAVPPGTGCTVTMNSLSGRLQVDGIERRASPFARRQQVHLGKGGPLVHFLSVSGDLAVKPTAAVKPLPAEQVPEKPLSGV
jgi:hypothetical protein